MVFISAALIVSPVVTTDVILPQIAPPAGFESLLQPQRSFVDIYYGSQLVASQMVTHTQEWLEFSDPAAVVHAIPNLKDPGIIESALTGRLSGHSQYDCLTSGSEKEGDDCDSLKPSVASIVFSESRFIVTLLINPDYLTLQRPELRRYLPPSDAGWSLMQNVHGVWSGVRGVDNTDEYTLNLMSQMAYRESSLHLNASYSNNQHFQIQDMFLRRNYQGRAYSGGIIESTGFGFTFINNHTLLGARVATSDQTRVDTDFSNGTPLDIFLPGTGHVEVLREGRLLESWFLDAGNHQLNTSNLPYGAYEIDIVIRNETGQVVQQERRFFAKQYQLPPMGEWLYFAETGQVVNREAADTLPTSTDQWLFRAGINRRLTNTLAGNIMVATDRNQHLVEAGAYHLGPFHELVPSFMVANGGDYGFGLSGRLWFGNITINGSYYRLWRDQNPVTANTPLRSDKQAQTLLGDAFRQSSLSVNIPLLSGVLSYRYYLNDYPKPFNSTENHGLDYRRSLYRSRDLDVDMGISLNRSGNNKLALFSVELRYHKDHWSLNATPLAEYQKVENSHDRQERLRLLASFYDRDLAEGVLKADLGAENGSGENHYLARLSYDNRFGGVQLNANQTRNRFARTDFYSASFHSSFMANQSLIAIGGERLENSAVVVHINAQKEDNSKNKRLKDAVFDVQVDGYRRGYAVADQSSVIQLPAYHQYHITLNPKGSSLYEFNELQRSVTLYPGNVVTLNYDATPLQLWFGRLMINGEPLVGARIRGGQYPAASDDLGLFQVEVPASLDTLTVELKDNRTCRLTLPEGSDHFVQRMGTIDLATLGCSAD